MERFCKYVKYPRTWHLNFGQKISKGDRILKDNSQFGGKKVVVTVKLDGENCLDPSSVIITDKGENSIKKICKNPDLFKILSFNCDKGVAEFKEIEAISILKGKDIDEWYEIKTEEGDCLKLTGDHRVFLPSIGCYRKVKDLNGSENILLKK